MLPILLSTINFLLGPSPTKELSQQNRELPSGLEARILTEDVWLLNQRFVAIRPAPPPP
jgi:hypothetical protein